jgi:hypothetical protein
LGAEPGAYSYGNGNGAGGVEDDSIVKRLGS